MEVFPNDFLNPFGVSFAIFSDIIIVGLLILLPDSHPNPSLPLPPMTTLFPNLSGIQAHLLGFSFLFDCFGSVGCIVGILFFIANIQLSVRTYFFI